MTLHSFCKISKHLIFNVPLEKRRGEQLLTVCRQVVDQAGQKGDEHAGDDDVNDVEERFPFNDQVEGDVLVLVALHGNVLVGVFLGWPVDDLPLTVLCRHQRAKFRSLGLNLFLLFCCRKMYPG